MPKRTVAEATLPETALAEPADTELSTAESSSNGKSKSKAKGTGTKRVKKPGPETSPHAGPVEFQAGEFEPSTHDKFIASIPKRSTASSAGANHGLKVVSYNVNGLRAATKPERLADLQAYFTAEDADVVCLQETKIDDDTAATPQFTELLAPSLPHAYFVCSTSKKGYAGCAIYSRTPALSVRRGLGEAEHDGEGRVIAIETQHCWIVNVYVPNSGMSLERLEYRTAKWDPAMRAFVQSLQTGVEAADGSASAVSSASASSSSAAAMPAAHAPKPVILIGDLNVAYHSMDVHDPVSNFNKTPGFCDGERDGFATLLSDVGLSDVWRERNPTQQQFTYWSPRFDCRSKNKGWRLDYALVSRGIASKVVDVGVRSSVPGVDHIPLYLELKL
jgi:exonuclease III